MLPMQLRGGYLRFYCLAAFEERRFEVSSQRSNKDMRRGPRSNKEIR